MKKIIVAVILFCVSGCSKENQSIVCSTLSQDESTFIDIKYTYGINKEIISMKKSTSVTFNEKSLKGMSLEEKQRDIQNEYVKYNDIKGLKYAISLDKTNRIIKAEIEIDLSLYDFKKDHFELGKKSSYEDVTEVVKDIHSLGYYQCTEN